MAHNKRQPPISSSAAISGGNDDLLIEIFIFLPAKSLVRFKLVSKHWHSRISAPSFSRLHILHQARRRPEHQHLFILSGIKFQFFICHPAIRKLVPFDFQFQHFARSSSYIKILQSCNGLLLLECGNSPRGHKEYYVCNPATSQYRDLCLKEAFSGIYLMFDPSKSHHYWVVCVRSVRNSTSFLVYDSEFHEWKDAGNSNYGPRNFRGGVYCDGRIYFLRFYGTSFCVYPEGEIFTVRDLPRARTSGEKNYVMESNGNLHYLSLSLKPDHDILLYVFQMKNDGYIEFCGDSDPISVKFRR